MAMFPSVLKTIDVTSLSSHMRCVKLNNDIRGHHWRTFYYWVLKPTHTVQQKYGRELAFPSVCLSTRSTTQIIVTSDKRKLGWLQPLFPSKNAACGPVALAIPSFVRHSLETDGRTDYMTPFRQSSRPKSQSSLQNPSIHCYINQSL